MKTMEWRFDASRPSWYPYPGPWDDEPDKAQWVDEATGLPCLIVRNRLGALCGYVGVSAGHPFFEKGYDDVPVDVHGGLTFSGKCQPEPIGDVLDRRDPEERVCHVVDPGEDDNVWWLGFDTAHMNDLVPGMNKKFEARPNETVGQIKARNDLNKWIDERITMSSGPVDDILRETYKTFGYVKEEVTQLAAQLRPLTRTQRVHRRLKGEAKQ